MLFPPQHQYGLLHSVTVKCGATVGNGLLSVVVIAIRQAQPHSRRNRRVAAPSNTVSTAHTMQCYNTAFQSCQHRTHSAVLQYRLPVLSASQTPCSVTIPPSSPVSIAHTLQCYNTTSPLHNNAYSRRRLKNNIFHLLTFPDGSLTFLGNVGNHLRNDVTLYAASPDVTVPIVSFVFCYFPLNHTHVFLSLFLSFFFLSFFLSLTTVGTV